MIESRRNAVMLLIFFGIGFGSLSIKAMEPPQPPERTKRIWSGAGNSEQEKKAKLNLKLYELKIPPYATLADKALLLAAVGGSREGVLEALAGGADPNTLDLGGATPLILAAVNGHLELVRLFLDRGASIEAVNNDGVSALLAAAVAGHKAVVTLLLDTPANIKPLQNGGTALHAAAIGGHETVVRLLLDRDSSIAVTVKNDNDTTPLHFAARQGQFGAVRELLRWGAPLPNGMRYAVMRAFAGLPLLAAAFHGELDRIKGLINRETKSSEILEALMYAIAQSHERVVGELISELVQRGAIDELFGGPLAHINRLHWGRDLTSEQAAGYARIRALILAASNSALIHVRNEYIASPDTRRAHARFFLQNLLSRPLLPLARARYFDLYEMLRHEVGHHEAPATTVLNRALRCVRDFLRNPEIVGRERTQYRDLELLMQPSRAQAVVQRSIKLLQEILKKMHGGEHPHYGRLLSILRHSPEMDRMIHDALKLIEQRLSTNLSIDDRQHYENLRKLLSRQKIESYLEVVPEEVFMRIAGFSLPRG